MTESEYELKDEERQGDEFVLSISGLKTQFFTYGGVVQALDGVNIAVKSGEIYGLVGESGCGKSVTAMSIMDLVPDPPGRIVSGKIFINGFNVIWDIDRLAKIYRKSEDDVKIRRNSKEIKRHNRLMSQIRGKWVSMVFQEPSLSLNPVLSIGKQLIDPIIIHEKASLADSIIRREKITRADLDGIFASLEAEKSAEARQSMISDWCNEFGLLEIENDFQRMVGNDEDLGIISKKIARMIKALKSGADLATLSNIRKYELQKRAIFDMTLEHLNARQENNSARAKDLSDRIKEMSGKMPSHPLHATPLFSIIGRKYNKLIREEAKKKAIRMLESVNLSDPERILKSFPHELSGGMQQRIMIAMALSLSPKVLIADEPTTALDVTTQAQILDLIKKLNDEAGTSVVFITHDLAVVAQMCNSVGVMYAGNLVEEAVSDELFANPKHPYTVGLLNSLPRSEKEVGRDEKFESISGDVPNLVTPPSGCRFHPRCKFKMDVCEQEKPEPVDLGNNHKVACFLYSESNAGEVAR